MGDNERRCSMSQHDKLIQQYRASRKRPEDHRLANTISIAADLIIKLSSGFYESEQTEDVWEMVEVLIRRYADGEGR